jgi:hypothetical protein
MENLSTTTPMATTTTNNPFLFSVAKGNSIAEERSREKDVEDDDNKTKPMLMKRREYVRELTR